MKMHPEQQLSHMIQPITKSHHQHCQTEKGKTKKPKNVTLDRIYNKEVIYARN